MAMSPKIVTNSLEAKRKTLRSNSKHPVHNNNPIYSTQNDKVVNQIKTELEHQEANNATKTSFPAHGDLKPLQQLILHSQQPLLSIQNVQQQTYVSEKPDGDDSMGKASEISLEDQKNSPKKTLLQSYELEKKQTNLSTPPKKNSFKTFRKTQDSSFNGERKSYRKIKKDHNRLIPFRRCQEQLQNRIVTLINKICQNKHQEKEIQIFCDKINKISFKDMCNPYVISGIQTVLNILSKTSSSDHTQICLRLKHQVKKLSQKVWEHLGKVDYYEEIIHEKEQIDLELVRPKLVRKVYKILIQQKKCEPNLAKSKSYEVCDTFLTKWNQQTSQDDLIEFLKEQKFIKI